MDIPPETPRQWKTPHLHLPDFPRSSLSNEFPAEFFIFFSLIRRRVMRAPLYLDPFGAENFPANWVRTEWGHTDSWQLAEIRFLRGKSLNFDLILAPFYNFILTILPVLLYLARKKSGGRHFQGRKGEGARCQKSLRT